MIHRALLLLLVLAAPALGQDAFPIEKIDAKQRKQVQRIRKDATVRTGGIAQDVRCRSWVYRYLLTHLPVSSRWLRALKMGDYAITDKPNGAFAIDDNSGATATCSRALDVEGVLVIVAQGKLDVRVLPTISGSGVILIRYGPKPDQPGVLACTAGVDFRLDSGLLRALSRPFKKTLGRVLSEKMAGLIKSATALGEAIQKDPTAVYKRLAKSKVSKADLKTFREAFLSL